MLRLLSKPVLPSASEQNNCKIVNSQLPLIEWPPGVNFGPKLFQAFKSSYLTYVYADA